MFILWKILFPCAHGCRALQQHGPLSSRLRLVSIQVHGSQTSFQLSLAGVELCAKTDGRDELFNLTFSHLKLFSLQTLGEHVVSAEMASVQLDNQMLDVRYPVVLAPSRLMGNSLAAGRARLTQGDHPHHTASAALMSGFPPDSDALVRFRMVRSYSASRQQYLDGVAGPAASTDEAFSAQAAIVSFKFIELEMDALDLEADQPFLEAVYMYVNALPLSDLWQTDAWQQQQAMQRHRYGSGPLTDALRPAAGSEGAEAPGPPDLHESVLGWLVAKEAAELASLKGQSSIWFFVERGRISDINVNVTISLSSVFNSNATPNRSGADSRGRQGFQLLNVNNVPIHLHGIAFENRLYNQVALTNILSRHYTWVCLVESRKLMGGAGPAIATIPASLLWAGFSVVDLTRDIASRKASARKGAMQVGVSGAQVFAAQPVSRCCSLSA